jgi:hypothetical protein
VRAQDGLGRGGGDHIVQARLAREDPHREAFAQPAAPRHHPERITSPDDKRTERMRTPALRRSDHAQPRRLATAEVQHRRRGILDHQPGAAQESQLELDAARAVVGDRERPADGLVLESTITIEGQRRAQARLAGQQEPDGDIHQRGHQALHRLELIGALDGGHSGRIDRTFGGSGTAHAAPWRHFAAARTDAGRGIAGAAPGAGRRCRDRGRRRRADRPVRRGALEPAHALTAHPRAGRVGAGPAP